MFRIIVITINLLLLSGCADNFRGFFKKSANNKWIDSKGFHGQKRKPLYNKKYIGKAKRNIIEQNFEDDEDYDDLEDAHEISNPARINRQMYIDMIKQDSTRRQRRPKFEAYKARYYEDEYDDDSYPSLVQANERMPQQLNNDKNLQKELTEIKAMLNDAKKDLAKYRCPMEPTPIIKKNSNIQNSGSTNKQNTNKPNESLKKKSLKEENYLEEDEDYKKINSNSKEESSDAPHPI